MAVACLAYCPYTRSKAESKWFFECESAPLSSRGANANAHREMDRVRYGRCGIAGRTLSSRGECFETAPASPACGQIHGCRGPTFTESGRAAYRENSTLSAEPLTTAFPPVWVPGPPVPSNEDTRRKDPAMRFQPLHSAVCIAFLCLSFGAEAFGGLVANQNRLRAGV